VASFGIPLPEGMRYKPEYNVRANQVAMVATLRIKSTGKMFNVLTGHFKSGEAPEEQYVKAVQVEYLIGIMTRLFHKPCTKFITGGDGSPVVTDKRLRKSYGFKGKDKADRDASVDVVWHPDRMKMAEANVEWDLDEARGEGFHFLRHVCTTSVEDLKKMNLNSLVKDSNGNVTGFKYDRMGYDSKKRTATHHSLRKMTKSQAEVSFVVFQFSWHVISIRISIPRLSSNSVTR